MPSFSGSLALVVVQAALIVGLSRLLGVAARALGQPMVIAEIVAGIALGPSLLGRLFPSVSTSVFPPASIPALGAVSQFGLILFMFMIGLEFDPKVLSGRGRASIVISHTSIIVPFAFGALLAQFIHSKLAGHGVPPSSFMLFLGAAMSVTAFPVLARILSERRLVGTRIGGMALACAAVDDATAWCILAFVVAIVRYSGVGNALLTTALAATYVAALAFLVRPALQKLSEHSSKRGRITENHVALIWLAALVSASVTELIGIHALFGAFALGAVVPNANGFAQRIAVKSGPIVSMLLLPLFFAYSGLRTEIGLVHSASDWAMCAVIVLVACVGKFGGTTVAARLTGMDLRESSALGILMNTRGLMELVILNIGLDLGVISPKLFAMMVLMALITTFATTPLLAWVYPAGAAARNDGVVRRHAGLRNAA
jgi:Kef-type K+ transport system membrane component KefB